VTGRQPHHSRHKTHLCVQARGWRYEQQLAALPEPRNSAWTGGHGTEPYEQNTQQSPGFGRSMTPHPAQR